MIELYCVYRSCTCTSFVTLGTCSDVYSDFGATFIKEFNRSTPWADFVGVSPNADLFGDCPYQTDIIDDTERSWTTRPITHQDLCKKKLAVELVL